MGCVWVGMARSQPTQADTTTDPTPTPAAGGGTRTFTDRDGRDDAMGDAIAEWTDDLVEGVQAAESSNDFQAWLDVQSAFHDYSARNTLLIKMQRPDATKVAGFWTWQNEFDRYVQEGENAIWIWGPINAKKCPECGNAPGYHDRVACDNDEDGDPEEWSTGVVGFQPVSVFDVSQTAGEPLPELDTDAGAGDVADPDALRAAVEAAASRVNVAGVDVVPPGEWRRSSSVGVADYGDADTAAPTPTVRVKGGRGPAAIAGTLIHEYAHAELHDPRTADDEREKREVEAEAVAYVVGRYYGLDVAGSELYVARWSEDSGGEIRERLDRISRTAETIIEAIDAHNAVGRDGTPAAVEA